MFELVDQTKFDEHEKTCYICEDEQAVFKVIGGTRTVNCHWCDNTIYYCESCFKKFLETVFTVLNNAN